MNFEARGAPRILIPRDLELAKTSASPLPTDRLGRPDIVPTCKPPSLAATPGWNYTRRAIYCEPGAVL